MDLERAKKGMRISAIAIILLIGSASRIVQPGSIRAVEVVSLIGLGMGIGVFLVHFIYFIKLKRSS